ncbi:MAG: polysaccharide biosynthesis/export family protein [Dysgonamonadaceae bacterium]|jgi:polysaccharide export outer membrane protein|nr:polysaccharide biosynthesis/export family protein [Dysgonamonadaceae bacterium]
MNKQAKKSFILAAIVIATVLCTSCTAYKKLPYFDGAESETLFTTPHEPKIMPNDVLMIVVNTNLTGTTNDFNLPLISAATSSVTQTNISGNYGGSFQNYIVDTDGYINFPVLGRIHVAGMTLWQLQRYLAQEIYPKYVAEQPIINVRFLNFNVSVLGEVVRPGTYNSANGQMTILDALAAAGDLTVYGRRDNVLLVRTTKTGETVFQRINLQDKNFVANKEFFFLQQGDKLYVETNKAKGNNSAFGVEQSTTLSAISIGLSAISLLVVIINASK